MIFPICQYCETICRFGMYRLSDQVFHLGFSTCSIPQLYVDFAYIPGPPCLDGFYPEFSPRNLGQLFPLGFKDDSSRFPSPFSGCNILKKLVCLLGGRYTNVII
jgi:hypothetical protein